MSDPSPVSPYAAAILGGWAKCPLGPSYFTIMLPALSVAVGNATALRISPTLPAETVTVKGTTFLSIPSSHRACVLLSRCACLR